MGCNLTRKLGDIRVITHEKPSGGGFWTHCLSSSWNLEEDSQCDYSVNIQVRPIGKGWNTDRILFKGWNGTFKNPILGDSYHEPPKNMKNQAFGHLNTRLFNIKTLKNM